MPRNVQRLMYGNLLGWQHVLYHRGTKWERELRRIPLHMDSRGIGKRFLHERGDVRRDVYRVVFRFVQRGSYLFARLSRRVEEVRNRRGSMRVRHFRGRAAGLATMLGSVTSLPRPFPRARTRGYGNDT